MARLTHKRRAFNARPIPKLKVGRINLKPLASPEELQRFKPERVLKSLQRDVLKSIKGKIMQETFSPEAKRLLLRSVTTKIGPSSLTVIAKHPAFIPLLKGQKPGQMRWLTKARRPIPIVLDSGELIFRSATARSMRNGSWYHPGRRPTTVIERARKEARAEVRKRIKKELAKQFRRAVAIEQRKSR